MINNEVSDIMFEKSINATTLLLSGIAFIILGSFMLVANQITMKLLLLLLGTLTILFGGYSIIKALWEENLEKHTKLIKLIHTPKIAKRIQENITFFSLAFHASLIIKKEF